MRSLGLALLLAACSAAPAVVAPALPREPVAVCPPAPPAPKVPPRPRTFAAVVDYANALDAALQGAQRARNSCAERLARYADWAHAAARRDAQ